MTAQSGRLRPFFPYYGSKWRLAPRYPAPTTPMIIEPFAGSAQYSTLHCDLDVRLYDLSRDIVDVWRYLISASPSDILGLPDVADGALVGELDLPAGARNLIALWCSPASARVPRRASGWHERHKGGANVWGAGVRSRIASQVCRIRHWQVRQASYAEIDNACATWFVDPPYQGRAGRSYAHGSMQMDYGHLSSWVRSRRGAVIACESGSAAWLPFVPVGTTKGATGRVSREAVWVSGFDCEQPELWRSKA